MVLWQTQKVATSARPGVRIPSAPASPLSVIFIDTRERYGYTFAGHAVRVERRALQAGDYAVAMGDSYVAVERKRMDDFANSLVKAPKRAQRSRTALMRWPR
jgi:ERCC4-type nuclease